MKKPTNSMNKEEEDKKLTPSSSSPTTAKGSPSPSSPTTADNSGSPNPTTADDNGSPNPTTADNNGSPNPNTSMNVEDKKGKGSPSNHGVSITWRHTRRQGPLKPPAEFGLGAYFPQPTPTKRSEASSSVTPSSSLTETSSSRKRVLPRHVFTIARPVKSCRPNQRARSGSSKPSSADGAYRSTITCDRSSKSKPKEFKKPAHKFALGQMPIPTCDAFFKHGRNVRLPLNELKRRILSQMKDGETVKDLLNRIGEGDKGHMEIWIYVTQLVSLDSSVYEMTAAQLAAHDFKM